MSLPKIKDYEAYLFDWDGTLAQTIEVWLDALCEVIPAFGGKADRAFVARTFGDMNTPKMSGVPESRIDEFHQTLTQAVMKRLAEVPLYDYAAAYLSELKQHGKKTALITTSRREALEMVLHRHALAEQFDVIITQLDVTNHKPHPEGIQYVLAKLGVPLDQALMLGDSDKDLGAARNAGIDSLLFYPDEHKEVYDYGYLQTFGPAYTIRSWRELLDAVQ